MGSANTKLLTGARDNDIDRVKSALEGGADVNIAEENTSNDPKKIPWQIKGTFPTTASETALIYATRHGNKEMVSLLLQHNARCDVCEATNHETPLHIACSKDRPSIVPLLLEANPSVIAARTTTGATPLHLACERSRDGASVKELIEKRNNDDLINATTEGDVTPLIRACGNSRVAVIQTLLDLTTSSCLDPGDEKKSKPFLDINKPSKYSTPLFDAVYHNSDRWLDVVKTLLQRGADPFATNNPTEMKNSVHHSVSQGNYHNLVAIVDFVKQSKGEEGVKELINAKTSYNQTPLMIAVTRTNGADNMIKYLLEQPGIDLEARDGSGKTAFELIQNDGYRVLFPSLS
mmetsp:Transcript_5211/g.6628  ORF Transcript_5211/g.6628 Transcript_5211/m.6628 type:complete len:348 (-) Transcript_5211:75-1118(-)|eukprot:CAMPEP_0201492186 /NCGR_PEP_ID=MMETSP0151_2-20130828/32129_1 /ASSEMBLY_ACC=CAM_ASM_000257 /TAXON_ID=200890 /ORGANISM="Paramoeba atlantica, Strain 621/1 / CCAP 1560/9" /LENGTH=347 /DNA_ID=CAMNT_0047878865 /DNA_START=97 /DNA_END=1140 /DNA_ORIENTATION=+